MEYYHTALGSAEAYMEGEYPLSVFRDHVNQRKDLINFVLEEQKNTCLLWGVAKSFISYNAKKSISTKDCIQVMLELGADPNQKVGLYSYGNTVLHWLIANDHPDYAIDFINMKTGPDNKFDFEIMDNMTFKTPLLFIVGRKYFYGKHGSRLKVADQALIEELVKLGADINMADAHFNTPLHIACVKRDVDAVKALLSSSTLNSQSLKAKNNLEKEPIDMLDLSYDESRAIIYKIYPNDIDDIIQKTTVNSPEANQNAEQIRQLILDKQNELGTPGTLEESSIRAEFIGGHNEEREVLLSRFKLY